MAEITIEDLKNEAWEAFWHSAKENDPELLEGEHGLQILKTQFEEYWVTRLKLRK